MKIIKSCIPFILPTIAVVPNAFAVPVTIYDVPAYNWYHGCGPTAAASIFGYYDLNGYDNLFDVTGWDDVKLTANVQEHISSTAHNTFYNPTPDLSGAPPADISIADFYHTSEDPLRYGASYLSYSDDAFIGYANYRGYDDWTAWNESYGAFTWNDLVNEIDNGRPLMFGVDSRGDGSIDHAVPVLGYDTEHMQYGLYTTWTENETIEWYNFQGMSGQYRWGVGSATFIIPGVKDVIVVPEPSTLLLMVTGLAGHVLTSRRRLKRL
jgi:hypothetical protein